MITAIRISFIITIWILILSSCSYPTPVDDLPIKIKDNNGTLHYYTMFRLTSYNEPVRYCGIHEEWEYVETLSDYQKQINTREIIN